MAQFEDSFTGTDGTPLIGRDLETGQTWDTTGTWELNGNRVRQLDSGFPIKVALVRAVHFDFDQAVDIILPATGLWVAGLTFRSADGNNYWRAAFDNRSGTEQVRIIQVVNGTGSTKVIVNSSGLAGTTRRIRATATGTALKVYMGTTEMATFTLPAPTIADIFYGMNHQIESASFGAVFLDNYTLDVFPAFEATGKSTNPPAQALHIARTPAQTAYGTTIPTVYIKGEAKNRSANPRIFPFSSPQTADGELILTFVDLSLRGNATSRPQTATGSASITPGQGFVARGEATSRTQTASGSASTAANFLNITAKALTQGQQAFGSVETANPAFGVIGTATSGSQNASGTALTADTESFTVVGEAISSPQTASGTLEPWKDVALQNFRVYRSGEYLVVEIRANKSLLSDAGGAYFWNYYSQPGFSLTRSGTPQLKPILYKMDGVSYYVSDGGKLLSTSSVGDIRYTIQFTDIPQLTPNIANDVFRGFYPVRDLPDGDYRVEGYVRSLSGQTTVIGDTQGSQVLFELRQDITFRLLGGKARDWSDISAESLTDSIGIEKLTDVIDVVSLTKTYDVQRLSLQLVVEEV